MALVDAYDAMTSIRPYKAAISHEVAVERILADRGRHFDPDVVDAFMLRKDEFPEIRERIGASSSTEPFRLSSRP